MRNPNHSDQLKIANWLNQFGMRPPLRSLETEEGQMFANSAFDEIAATINRLAQENDGKDHSKRPDTNPKRSGYARR